MAIFISTLVALTLGAEVNLEITAKARNLILAQYGDHFKTIQDFNQYFQVIAKDFFGLQFIGGDSFASSFQLLHFDFKSLIESQEFPFKESANELIKEVNRIYKEEITSLRIGSFDAFFTKLDKIQKQLFTFLMAKNLNKKIYVGELAWNSGIYLSLQQLYRKSIEKLANGKKLADEFDARISGVLAETENLSKVYNSYEHLIKNTDADLKTELEFILHSVLKGKYEISDKSSFNLNLSKILGLTETLSLLRDAEDYEAFYVDMARLLINKRISLFQSQVLSADLNNWILHAIHGYIVALQNQNRQLAALGIFQRLLIKELPTLVKRESLGNSLAEIAKMYTVFENEQASVDERTRGSNILVLASLIVTGNVEFFTEENIAQTIDNFFVIMSYSFNKFMLYRQLSPILFNQIVSDQISTDFINLAIIKIEATIEEVSISTSKINVYETFNNAIDTSIYEEEYTGFYVPLKIANILLAKANNANLHIQFKNSSRTRSNLRRVLATEEFEKLERIIQHLWNIDFGNQVHQIAVESKDWVDWLLTQKLSSNSFDDVVIITNTQDPFVHTFNALQFPFNFIDEAIIIEEDREITAPGELQHQGSESLLNQGNEAILEEEQEVNTNPTMLNRKKEATLRNKKALKVKDDIEEESVQTNENHASVVQEDLVTRTNDNHVEVLKGLLNLEEFEFITKTENLAELLKEKSSFINSDGVHIEITYAQVVYHNSPCHDSIVEMLSNI